MSDFNEAYEEARLMGVRGRAAREQAHFDGMFSPEATSAIPPPHNGTPTSRDAAEKKASSAPAQRAMVLNAIRTMGAATRDDLQVALGLDHQSLTPRVWELLGNGGHPRAIEETGETRPTRSGRQAVLLRAV